MDAEGRVSRRPLEQELVSRGVRMTHQRRLLVQIIQGADGHLDAVALWQRAKDQDPTINKVTVYRTLAMLKKHGLVDELDLMHLEGGKHYYEAKTTRDHIHLACIKCGRIQEFESSLFEKLKGQIERERQFRISTVRVEAGGRLRPLQVTECKCQRQCQPLNLHLTAFRLLLSLLGGAGVSPKSLWILSKMLSLLALHHGGAGGGIQVVANGFDFHFPARQQFVKGNGRSPGGRARCRQMPSGPSDSTRILPAPSAMRCEVRP